MVLYFAFFLIYVTISVTVSILNNVSSLYLNQFFGIFFTVIFSFFFFLKFEDRLDLLIHGIKFTIWIHIIFFIFQFVNFYMFNNYIDLIEPITGETQRNIGGVFSGGNGMRGSGLYGESAAYALNILVFNFILLVREKKIGLISTVSLITVFLSMSSSGIIYSIVFLGIYFIFYNICSLNKI